MDAVTIPEDLTEITLDWLRGHAAPSAWSTTHTEVIVDTHYGEHLPLPSNHPRDRQYLMSGGGFVRYLFHHLGAIEVECINGDGVVRELFSDTGEQLARVWTARENYTPRLGSSSPASMRAWEQARAGKDDDFSFQRLAWLPPIENDVALSGGSIVRNLTHSGGVFEVEQITRKGVSRRTFVGEDLIASSYTPIDVYTPVIPLRQYG